MLADFSARVNTLRSEGQPWERISVAEIKRDWAADALHEIRSSRVKTTVPCEIQAVRVGGAEHGGAVLLAAPLEIFTQTALAIKQASPASLTVICSNSNGGVGYLPTQDAYDANDYTNPEGLAPKVYGIYALARDAEDCFRQNAIQFLHQLFE
jgi:hypothetical protein